MNATFFFRKSIVTRERDLSLNRESKQYSVFQGHVGHDKKNIERVILKSKNEIK
jgi:hypothetical protein